MHGQKLTIGLERFTTFGDLLKFLRRRSGWSLGEGRRRRLGRVGLGHAICRRAVQNVMVRGGLFCNEGRSECQPMAYGAALLVRRHNHDMGEPFESKFEASQPLGFNPVIVGEQYNFHGTNK